MKFHHCLKLSKILRKQNVTDGHTDGKTEGQRENSIPAHKHSLRGYNKFKCMYTYIFTKCDISFSLFFNVAYPPSTKPRTSSRAKSKFADIQNTSNVNRVIIGKPVPQKVNDCLFTI